MKSATQKRVVCPGNPKTCHLPCPNRGNRSCARQEQQQDGYRGGWPNEPPTTSSGTSAADQDQVRRSCRTARKRNCRGRQDKGGRVVSHARFTARKTSSATTEKGPWLCLCLCLCLCFHNVWHLPSRPKGFWCASFGIVCGCTAKDASDPIFDPLGEANGNGCQR
jgi:hypothetical protein